ncbi:hypothetical protein FOCC_FOCC012441 [Frankliniella occidentalis]|nr:hypothetical protein FOCC_FOCC012441 [Frankliniella occidentalis]
MEDLGSDSDNDNHEEQMLAQFHWAHGKIDERHHAADMIINCRQSCTMTRAGVRTAMDNCELMLEARTENLKRKVEDFLNQNNYMNNPLSARLLNNFECESPFKNFKSNSGQKSAVKSYYHYIEPVPGFLGYRIEPINVGGNIFRQRPVRETFHFVSIKEILKMVSRKQSVLDYIHNLRPREDDLLTSYTDGNSFANHPYFQRFPDAFQIGLYFDDCETTSSNGSKTGPHNMACFYVKILNAPPYINSHLAGTHVVALAHTQDVKTYGFRPILQPLIDDLLELESENGVVDYIGDQRIVLRGALAAVLGDSKAVHEILGFLLPSARHFCRLCTISRRQLHARNVIFGERRTEAMHNHHVEEAELNPANSTLSGVKENSCLHDLQYFHSSKNIVLDSQHDIAHGIGEMEIKLVLNYYVSTRHLFTAADLNTEVKTFLYGRPDVPNEPSNNFSPEGLAAVNQRSFKLAQTSAQIFCLMRVLIFLLDILGIPIEDREHLDLIILLQKIVQIIKAPKVSRSILPYLRRLIESHRRMFHHLFPGVNPINKHHHLEHYVDVIEEMGPSEQFSCMRQEAKHRPLKRHIVACNSYRSVTKTASDYEQISQAIHWGSNVPHIVPKFVLSKKKTPCAVNDCYTRRILIERGFRADEFLNTVETVAVFGRDFYINDFVVVRVAAQNNNDMESFGKIKRIISANNETDVWFEIEEWRTEYESESFNSLIISQPDNAVHHLLDPLDLPLHPPLAVWHDRYMNKHLCLRHLVL